MGDRVLTICIEELKRSPLAWRAEAARRLTLTLDQLDKRLRKDKDWKAAKVKALKELESDPSPMDPTHPELRSLEQRVLTLQDQNSVLRSKLKDADREDSATTVIIDRIRSIIPVLPAVGVPKLVKTKGATSVETMVQLLGDGHFYEQVSLERTRGFNMYGIRTGAARLAHCVKTHLEIKDRLESHSGWYFPRLVLPLLGDWISGTIHEVERHGDASVIDAAVGTASLLAQAIQRFAAHYPEVCITGVVGNHGRLPDARKKQQKDPSRNWDFLVHEMARQNCRALTNVKWYLPRAYDAQLEIEGYQVLFTHGDNVRGWGRYPMYGMTQYTSGIQNAEAGRDNLIDFFVMGHWHDRYDIPVPAGRLLVNGSIIGTTEFDLSAARVSQPKQLMFGMKAKHGVTHRWDINLLEPDPDVEPFELYPPPSAMAGGTIGEVPLWKVA